MKILVVEDEVPAIAHITHLIGKLIPEATIIAELDSVKSVVEWFSINQSPDLAFFDIQLADGLSFEIFQQVKIKCPIVFTTAYDQYALKAFEVNSIDYLLKPIREQHLQRALGKFKNRNPVPTIDPGILKSLLNMSSKQFKEQFVIKVGEHLRTVSVTDAAVYSSEDRSTYLYTFDGQKHLLDQTLDGVQEIIDPGQFYRVSRKHIVNLKAIKDIITFSKSRLKIEALGYVEENIIVSRERVQDFKSWLDR